MSAVDEISVLTFGNIGDIHGHLMKNGKDAAACEEDWRGK
jgi:hypothetical protein